MSLSADDTSKLKAELKKVIVASTTKPEDMDGYTCAGVIKNAVAAIFREPRQPEPAITEVYSREGDTYTAQFKPEKPEARELSDRYNEAFAKALELLGVTYSTSSNGVQFLGAAIKQKLSSVLQADPKDKEARIDTLLSGRASVGQYTQIVATQQQQRQNREQDIGL